MENRKEYIINKLMADGFIEPSHTSEVLLEEQDKDGESKLLFKTKSDNPLIIKNIDKKKTDMLFFKNDKSLCMYKRVDHIIMDCVSNEEWNIYLIEMKSSVKDKKWVEIKGKFRASYMLMEAIAAMLHIKVKEFKMFTTYERVDWNSTVPTRLRARTGTKNVPFDKEWSGAEFGIDMGERVGFVHRPIEMTRNDKNILVGKCNQCT